MTKSQQLKKARRVNPKKMTKIEYELYVDFVNEKSFGNCQLCGSKAQDIHHSHYGAGGRDDRYIIAICRSCHTKIHSASPKDVDIGSQLKLLAKGIGKRNWSDYNG